MCIRDRHRIGHVKESLIDFQSATNAWKQKNTQMTGWNLWSASKCSVRKLCMLKCECEKITSTRLVWYQHQTFVGELSAKTVFENCLQLIAVEKNANFCCARSIKLHNKVWFASCAFEMRFCGSKKSFETCKTTLKNTGRFLKLYSLSTQRGNKQWLNSFNRLM